MSSSQLASFKKRYFILSRHVHLGPLCVVRVRSTANACPGGAGVRACFCVVAVKASVPCVATVRAPFCHLPPGRLTCAQRVALSTPLPLSLDPLVSVCPLSPAPAPPVRVPCCKCSPGDDSAWLRASSPQ